MRRICCFCETWESGGIESFLYNTLLHMDRSELEIDIVAARLGESIFTEELLHQGICFRELSGDIRNLPQNFKLFLSLMQERKYDVVHLNLYQGLSLYYCVLAKKAGIPVRIVHSHNTDLRKSLTRQLKYFLHNVGKHFFGASATDRWACSVPAGEFLFSKKPFQVISNGIDVDKFCFNETCRSSMREAMGLTGKFVIGHVGRLSYQKNQSFLLDILAEALKKEPNSVLLLIGDGSLRDELEEKARKLHVADHVVFYGVTNQVRELLWCMDVFVFPSHLEGLGIVAIEAQAAGLPVLCSEHVPAEANVTELFQSLPLAAGEAVWAEKVLSLSAASREQFPEKVRAAGFDITDSAKRIQNFFLRQVI